jgi:ankyrin repeat protein
VEAGKSATPKSELKIKMMIGSSPCSAARVVFNSNADIRAPVAGGDQWFLTFDLGGETANPAVQQLQLVLASSGHEEWFEDPNSLSQLKDLWNVWPLLTVPPRGDMREMSVRRVVAMIKSEYRQFERRSCFAEKRAVHIDLGQFPLVMREKESWSSESSGLQKEREVLQAAAAPLTEQAGKVHPNVCLSPLSVPLDMLSEEEEEPQDTDLGQSPRVVSLETLCELPRCLLFGVGGIGKSSFCLSLCRDWANDQAKFDCVVYVDLVAELAKEGAPFVSLNDVVFAVVFKSDKSSQRLCHDFTVWLSKPATRVLWVLDGCDQVEHKLRGTIFSQLQNGTFAQGQDKHVLLVTRLELTEGPSRIDRNKYQCYELLGFDDDTVLQYIHAYFVDTPEKRLELRATLGFSKEFLVYSCNRDRPRTFRKWGNISWIHEAAKNPLLLDLMCDLFDRTSNLNDLSRKTRLYEKVFDLCLRANGELHQWWEKECHSDGKLKKAWMALCCTAWTSLVDEEKVKGIVSRSQLSKQWIVESSFLDKIDRDTWKWTNFTFQEFLAARWVCHYMPIDQVGPALKDARQNFGDVFVGFVIGMEGKNQALTCLEQWMPMSAPKTPHPVFGKPDDDVGRMVALIEECAPENLHLFRAFVKSNHDWSKVLNKNIVEAVTYAASHGSLQAVRTLVELFRGSAELALHCAAQEGHVNIVEWTGRRVSSVDVVCYNGQTALLLAAVGGHELIVRHLLERGANPNVVDAFGQTALCQAVWGGNPRVVQLLFEQRHCRGDLDGKSRINGETLLSMATRDGFVEIASMLLHAGAGVDVMDGKGMTPLHIACSIGNADLVKLLIEHEANVKAVTADRGKQSPLHLAVARGIFSNDLVHLVRLLLDNGADRHAKDAKGRTALNVAQASRTQVVELCGEDVFPEQTQELLLILGQE